MLQIAELNNFAVTCIQENKVKEAVNALRRALELTKTKLSCSTTSDNSKASSPVNTSLISSFVPKRRAQRQPMETSVMMSQIPSDDSCHRLPFKSSAEIRYHQPIVINAKTLCCAVNNGSRSPPASLDSNAVLHSELATIVIFNLALCFDLISSSSTTTSSRQSDLDAKATALYEKVVELYFQTNVNTHENGDTIRLLGNDSHLGIASALQDVVVMAAINNLIHLYQERAKKDCYAQLLTMLTREIAGANYVSDELRRQVDWQACIFLSNTMLFSGASFVMAAAVA